MAWIHFRNEFLNATSLSGNGHSQAVAVDKKIYIFRGDHLKSRPRGFHTIVFDTEDFSWSLANDNGPKRPLCMSDFVAIPYGRAVCAFGAYSEPFSCKIVYCFKTQTQKWGLARTGGDIPFSSKRSLGCRIEKKIWMFPNVFTGHLNDDWRCLFCLDMTTLEWKRVCRNAWDVQMRPERIACMGTTIFVAFVKEKCKEFSLWSFCTVTQEWESKQPPNVISFSGEPKEVFARGENIYVIVSIVAGANRFLKYSVEGNDWEEIACLGHPREVYTCTSTVNNKMYFFDFSNTFSMLSVLDMMPDLRTFCTAVINSNNLDTECLPLVLQNELKPYMVPVEYLRNIKSTQRKRKSVN